MKVDIRNEYTPTIFFMMYRVKQSAHKENTLILVI